MNLPNEEILINVRRWISYADDDLNVASSIMNLRENPPYRLAAFLAQQCVEKMLKAWLIFHSIDFPHTHRILLLLEMCPNKEEWSDTLLDAEELTPYAVLARYPGGDNPVYKVDAVRAIEIARQVRRVVFDALVKKDKRIHG